jgi:hypothetical protein
LFVIVFAGTIIAGGILIAKGKIQLGGQDKQPAATVKDKGPDRHKAASEGEGEGEGEDSSPVKAAGVLIRTGEAVIEPEYVSVAHPDLTPLLAEELQDYHRVMVTQVAAGISAGRVHPRPGADPNEALRQELTAAVIQQTQTGEKLDKVIGLLEKLTGTPTAPAVPVPPASDPAAAPAPTPPTS